jgi:hypothetical protein
MAIDEPVSDTARGIQHEPDHTWPASVVLQVTWHVDGHNRTRTMVVGADQFYGRGQYGAPMNGEALIQAIERMRREGPPAPAPRAGPPRNTSVPARPKGKRHGKSKR